MLLLLAGGIALLLLAVGGVLMMLEVALHLTESHGHEHDHDLLAREHATATTTVTPRTPTTCFRFFPTQVGQAPATTLRVIQAQFRLSLYASAMFSARLRRHVTSSLIGWCVWGILLAALQPFIATHFRHDGWEDEPGFRIRSVSATANFEPDGRSEHPHWNETTLFVPASANIDVPHAFQQGLDHLLALVWIALPLTVLLGAMLPMAMQPPRMRRVPNFSGAPPPAAGWLRQPPSHAPPSKH